jgi:MFS family permease
VKLFPTGHFHGSYFGGFTLGALRCERIIERVGHIRAYAAFAGLVIAATALMPLLVGPIAWLILRAVIGFGCAGLFIATESWLSARQQSTARSEWLVGPIRERLKTFANQSNIENARAYDAIPMESPPRIRFGCFLTGFSRV